MVHLAEHVKKL